MLTELAATLDPLLPPLEAAPLPLVVVVVAGLALLFFGRRLFWLFVGLAGAVITLWLTSRVLHLETGVASLLAALVAGLVGALLAVLVQKAAVALMGFLGGAWAVLGLFELLQPGLLGPGRLLDFGRLPGEPWVVQAVAAVVGGILGALAAAWLFEIALVILTSLAGALLLVEASGLEGLPALGAGAGLAVAGILAQTASRRRRRREGSPRRRRRCREAEK